MSLEVPINPKSDQQLNGSNDSSTVTEDELQPETEQVYDDVTIDISPLFKKTYQIMEEISATNIGQYVLKHVDLVLGAVEETVKWRLPADNPNSCLIRPLPWMPFLMLIIVLRILLIYLSIGALLLGDGPVTAKRFIYFIQTRRRKLRFIRLHGMKLIQQRDNGHKADKPKNGLLNRLTNFFNTMLCRPLSHREEVKAVIVTRDSGLKKTNELHKEPEEPRGSKCQSIQGSPYMNCKDMLNKYANQNSDDDSDYVPAEEDEDSINNESFTSQDTSNENATDLSDTEKLENGATNSNINAKVPSLEVKHIGGDETTVQNSEFVADNQERISTESDITNGLSPKTKHSEHDTLDSGNTKNGGLDALVEVVQVQEVEKPQNALFVNLLNGHEDESKKSTPGHETAAHSKPNLPLPLLGNITNANFTNYGKFVDGNEDCFIDNNNQIPTNITTTYKKLIPTPTPIPQTPTPPQSTQAPSSLNSSPSCSTASSNSSLASFMTSNDTFGEVDRSDPPTPTPSPNATSSTEDIYQSPFGACKFSVNH